MTVGVAFEKYHENAVVPHLTVTAVTDAIASQSLTYL